MKDEPEASKPVSKPAEAPKKIPEAPVKESNVDKSISTYNGAKTAKYNWSQSINNVDVQVKLPKGTTSKQLIVTIKPKHLKVQIKGQPEPLIDGELCERVKSEDSFWSVEDEEFLNFNFEKQGEVIWKSVLVGDDEIDTKKLDNRKKLDEFDYET